MQVQPYLFFDGRCDEALEFYKKSIGAEVKMLMRWKDCPEQPKNKDMIPPGSENKVMHARLKIGEAVGGVEQQAVELLLERLRSQTETDGDRFAGYAPVLQAVAGPKRSAAKWIRLCLTQQPGFLYQSLLGKMVRAV